MDLSAAPWPEAGHFSVVDYRDREMGQVYRRGQVTDWRLPLDGSDMSLTLELIPED